MINKKNMMKINKIFKKTEKTPYFIANPKKANEQLQKVKKAFEILEPKISYLVNANSNDWMINTLKKEDINFTISTYEQATNLIDKGIPPENINIMNPSLITSDMEKCYEIGITKFQVYSHNQLEMLRNIKGNKKITLLTKTQEESLGLTLKELNIILGESSELDDITGLHYFFGTQSDYQRKNYEDLTKFIIFATQIKKSGYNIEEITISPGLPIEYDQKTQPIETITQEIVKRIKPIQDNNIQLNMLIGRYIAAPTMKLITTIKSIENKTAYVDASSYNSFMDSIIMKTKLQTYEQKQGKKTKYIIRGCTPDKIDILTEIETTELKPQTQLTLSNAGAYQITTDFANLKKPKTVITDE